MLDRRPHLLVWTKPYSSNKPDQGKQLLLLEHQTSFLIILPFLLKCSDRRKESWRSHMRHRFNQDSGCPSFKKSFNSMTEVPPSNLVIFPPSSFPFPSSSYLPIRTMAKLPLTESVLFAMLSNASLCTEAACFPACLLVEISCPYPEPDWAVAVGLGMAPNVISQSCNMTLEKWANFDLEQDLGNRSGTSRREAFNNTEDPTSLWAATLPCASYHSPCIAFGLQPDEAVSELHLFWSCCRVCTEKLWNNLRELRLWAAHSCLTWTVASGEHSAEACGQNCGCYCPA